VVVKVRGAWLVAREYSRKLSQCLAKSCAGELVFASCAGPMQGSRSAKATTLATARVLIAGTLPEGLRNSRPEGLGSGRLLAGGVGLEQVGALRWTLHIAQDG